MNNLIEDGYYACSVVLVALDRIESFITQNVQRYLRTVLVAFVQWCGQAVFCGFFCREYDGTQKTADLSLVHVRMCLLRKG